MLNLYFNCSFMYQYACQIKVDKDVGFMCPVQLVKYMHNPRECEEYIANVLKAQETKKYIMGAFYEG